MNDPKSEVFNEDCMEVMRRYPDKHFDLAVVDPPYGINVNMNMGVRKGEKRKHASKKWDNETPLLEYFIELFRVSKNQIIWGANHFTDKLPISRGWIFWDKIITGDVQFSQGELAWTSFDKSLQKFNYAIQNNYLQETRIHPTQKPIKLYEWIFVNYATEGMKILDTHLGSQSSRIAAYKAKLDFVGCELDNEYFDAGNKRFNDFKSQLTLF